MPAFRRSAQDIAQLNQNLSALGQRFVQLMAQGEHVAALAVNARAQALMPQHPQILGDAALCHLRLREYEKAYAIYLKACALGPKDVNLWDGLTEVCGHLGRMAEVRRHGAHSLHLKDQQTLGQVPSPLLASLPEAVREPQRQVIAFSLFGDNPRYGETAKLNVMVAQQLLPQWVCRFYVDDSVPEQVRSGLLALGAQVHAVSPQDRQELSGLMWHFWCWKTRAWTAS